MKIRGKFKTALFQGVFCMDERNRLRNPSLKRSVLRKMRSERRAASCIKILRSLSGVIFISTEDRYGQFTANIQYSTEWVAGMRRTSHEVFIYKHPLQTPFIVFTSREIASPEIFLMKSLSAFISLSF